MPCGEEDLWGVSALIMVPKKDGGWRPTLNLKPLNLYLRTDYSTRSTLKTIPPFVHQGWWGVSVDFSLAYYHLAMHQGEQPWSPVLGGRGCSFSLLGMADAPPGGMGHAGTVGGAGALPHPVDWRAAPLPGTSPAPQ